jgi:hypothetical protein
MRTHCALWKSRRSVRLQWRRPAARAYDREGAGSAGQKNEKFIGTKGHYGEKRNEYKALVKGRGHKSKDVRESVVQNERTRQPINARVRSKM